MSLVLAQTFVQPQQPAGRSAWSVVELHVVQQDVASVATLDQRAPVAQRLHLPR